MSEPRCPECGSWERECISPVPIADCGCNRCMRSQLAEAKSRLNVADAEVTMLRHFNAEAEALLREAREAMDDEGGWPITVARIDAHLAEDA